MGLKVNRLHSYSGMNNNNLNTEGTLTVFAEFSTVFLTSKVAPPRRAINFKIKK